MNITLQNEIVNYLNSGARADFFFYKGSTQQVQIQFTGDQVPAAGPVNINISYQRNGTSITTLPGVIDANGLLTFTIQPAPFEPLKLLNYWIDCIDAAGELLFYGSFTLI